MSYRDLEPEERPEWWMSRVIFPLLGIIIMGVPTFELIADYYFPKGVSEQGGYHVLKMDSFDNKVAFQGRTIGRIAERHWAFRTTEGNWLIYYISRGGSSSLLAISGTDLSVIKDRWNYSHDYPTIKQLLHSLSEKDPEFRIRYIEKYVNCTVVK